MVQVRVLGLGRILVLAPNPILTLILALILALILTLALTLVDEERLCVGVCGGGTRKEGTRKQQGVVGAIVGPFAGKIEAGQIHGDFVVLCWLFEQTKTASCQARPCACDMPQRTDFERATMSISYMSHHEAEAGVGVPRSQ
jgi:hypothetical protein